MSTATTFLDHTHFTLQRINEKLTLCTKLPGMSMVLFWTKDCEYCGEFKTIFKDLPSRVPNVRFGTCNVGIAARAPDGSLVDKPVHRMSVGTSTPINHVPFVIFYINNKPYKIYEGERTMSSVLRFISVNLTDIQKGVAKPKSKDEGNVETYGAIPKGRAKRCYLTVDSAYGNGGGDKAPPKRGGSYSSFADAYGLDQSDMQNISGMDGR